MAFQIIINLILPVLFFSFLNFETCKVYRIFKVKLINKNRLVFNKLRGNYIYISQKLGGFKYLITINNLRIFLNLNSFKYKF